MYKDFRLIYLKTIVRKKTHVRKHNNQNMNTEDILFVIPHHCTYKKTILQSFLSKKVFNEIGSSMMNTGAYNFITTNLVNIKTLSGVTKLIICIFYWKGNYFPAFIG